jgi:hypothetical protein
MMMAGSYYKSEFIEQLNSCHLLIEDPVLRHYFLFVYLFQIFLVDAVSFTACPIKLSCMLSQCISIYI